MTRLGECTPRLDALCLHGIGGSARQWRPVLAWLTNDVRGIAIDLPGHGDCSLPLGTPAPDVASYLFEAVRSVGGRSPFVVVGHSLGGVLALYLALHWPADVARLVLLASAARVRPHPLLLSQLAQGELDDHIISAGLGAGVAPEFVNWVVEDFRRAASRWAAGEIWGITGTDYTALLSSIRVPTIVAVPTGDQVISPRRGRELAAKIPGARLVLVAATGHYLQLELPALVARLISRGAPVAESGLAHASRTRHNDTSKTGDQR